MNVSISTKLAASPARVWSALKEPRTWVRVSRGMLDVANAESLPPAWEEGATIRVNLRFFHLLSAPWQHRISVLRVADADRRLETDESGGPIWVWKHRMCVDRAQDGTTRYTDQIEIQAGLLTPFVALYAHLFYRYRQWRWRRLCRSWRER